MNRGVTRFFHGRAMLGYFLAAHMSVFHDDLFVGKMAMITGGATGMALASPRLSHAMGQMWRLSVANKRSWWRRPSRCRHDGRRCLPPGRGCPPTQTSRRP